MRAAAVNPEFEVPRPPAAVTRSTDDEPSTEMTNVPWTEPPAAHRMTDERRSSATGCDQRWNARRRVTTTTSPDAGGAAYRTSLPSPRQVLLILTLLSTCCPGEGCWRRRSSPVTAAVQSSETTTQVSPKLNCTSEEATSTNCRNEGVCFVVETVGVRYPACVCKPEWFGRQCERRYVDPNYFASRHLTVCTTVGIVVGVFGLVISVFLAIIVAYLCHRHRRRTYDLKRQQQEVELAR